MWVCTTTNGHTSTFSQRIHWNLRSESIDTSTNWNHLKSSGAGRSLFSEWRGGILRQIIDFVTEFRKKNQKGKKIHEKKRVLKTYTQLLTILSYRKMPSTEFFQSTFHCYDIIQLSFSFFCIHFILFYFSTYCISFPIYISTVFILFYFPSVLLFKNKKIFIIQWKNGFDNKSGLLKRLFNAINNIIIIIITCNNLAGVYMYIILYHSLVIQDNVKGNLQNYYKINQNLKEVKKQFHFSEIIFNQYKKSLNNRKQH